MRRVLLLSLSLSFASLFLSCATLEKLDAGTCGNGVVDTSQREDCDGHLVDGFPCRGPDVAWPCSFDCTETHVCPTGFGCGNDGVCRKATGMFEEQPFAQLASQAQELLAGDFDADGRADVVGVEPGRFRIGFVDSTGAASQVIFSSPEKPAIGKLGPLNSLDNQPTTPDVTDDLVLPLRLGVGALLSGGDRSFTTKTYNSITLGKDDIPGLGTAVIKGVLPVAFDALPDPMHPGDETGALSAIAFGKDADVFPNGIFVNFGAGDSHPVLILKDTLPTNMLGVPVMANFDDDPCQEIIFPQKKSTLLRIYKACGPDGEWGKGPKDLMPTPALGEVDFEGRMLAGQVFARDLNGDGKLDLLIPVQASVGVDLRVAYGRGKGQFDSKPQPAGNNVPPDNKTGLVTKLPAALLAVGFLNDDGLLDAVDPNHILIGKQGAPGTFAFDVAYQSERQWTEAEITNLNGDGYADVVACTAGAPDIDVLTGNPSPFYNPLHISTDGTVSHLRIGDFDGDLVSDIAFQDTVSDAEDDLQISYGRTSGGPEAPQLVGTFGKIETLVAGSVLSFGADDISDIGVVSSFPETLAGGATQTEFALSFFPGSGDRFLQAPFLITEANDARIQTPIQGSLGFLRPWSPDSLEEAHNDLALLTYAQPDYGLVEDPSVKLDKDLGTLRLWGLFATGEADFQPADSASCHLSQGAFFFPGLPLASSVVTTSASIGGTSRVFVITPFVSDAHDLDKIAIHTMVAEATFDGSAHCSFPQELFTAAGEVLFRVRAVQLDDDERPEILAVRKTYGNAALLGLAQKGSMPGGVTSLEPDTSELVVFWNMDLGKNDKLSPSVPEKQPLDVLDYATADIDGDGKQEVIVLGKRGTTAFRLGDNGKGLVKKAFQESLLKDATAVLLADADGDGVSDLVVKTSSLQYYKGTPKQAVDSPGK